MRLTVAKLFERFLSELPRLEDDSPFLERERSDYEKSCKRESSLSVANTVET